MAEEKMEKFKDIVSEIGRINTLLEKVATQEDLCLISDKNILYLINNIWGKESTLYGLNCRKEELIRELKDTFKEAII